MTTPMSNERLEFLRDHCDGPGLWASEGKELIAEIDRLRAIVEKLLTAFDELDNPRPGETIVDRYEKARAALIAFRAAASAARKEK